MHNFNKSPVCKYRVSMFQVCEFKCEFIYIGYIGLVFCNKHVK